ncbi:MAG: glutathione S-transferase N-terminal domain-containing protein, partial [Pseudomonadota bacterium]
MAEYTLHCFGESGNAYKAALGLNLAGLDWEARFVDFFNGATRTPEFRALNAMGEVPVLETPSGVLSQSGAILAHLGEATGKFGSASDPEVLRWL